MLATVSIILNSKLLSEDQYHKLMDSTYACKYTIKDENEVHYSHNPALELLLVSASSPNTKN
jgi:hypothetical protein